MSGIFIAVNPDDNTIDAMDTAMRDWTMQAARGECGWICAGCCTTFQNGMPDTCAYGHQGCTDIIQRDKRAAQAAGKEQE